MASCVVERQREEEGRGREGHRGRDRGEEKGKDREKRTSLFCYLLQRLFQVLPEIVEFNIFHHCYGGCYATKPMFFDSGWLHYPCSLATFAMETEPAGFG